MILIVDDKPANLLSLKSILESHSFRVDTAQSGEETLKKILNNSYSLIILDVQMPGMDGFEVAEAMLGYSKTRETPIIFLSAVNTDKKFITKGYASGAVDYIAKPVDPDIFILKVKTLYRLSEQNRKLNEIQQSLRIEVESRKQAEEALNKTLRELRSVMESMPQIAFSMKPDGNIEYVNEQWYHFARDTHDFPEFHPLDQNIKDEWKQALKNGSPLVSEVRVRNLETGIYQFHLLRIIPVLQDGRAIKWVGTFTDIHQQKTDNEQLEVKVAERTSELIEKNKLLEASNYELQQFASVASHDLQEPLRKIQIFSSILKEKCTEGDEQARDLIHKIIGSSERMSRLISDLLNYSRLSGDAAFQPVNLSDIIGEIISDLEIPIREKEAQIIVGTLPILDAIPGQMRQVFQNLIGNSLKFSRDGIRPVIRIQADTIATPDVDSPPDQKGNFCRIVVTDNGIGFNENYTDKIFTIFQRLHSKEEFEGTGIGLAITRKIIERHNGAITAKSQEQEGSSFIMILPLHQAAAQQQALHY